MPPLSQNPKESGALETTVSLLPQPSTWKVVSTLTASVWFTYNLYISAKNVWQWIQGKLEKRYQNSIVEPQGFKRRLGKRQAIGKSKVFLTI